MKSLKALIGTTVNVKDMMHTYPHYEEMAQRMGLSNWVSGADPEDDVEARIVAIELHERDFTVVAGIDQGGRHYVIALEGLERL